MILARGTNRRMGRPKGLCQIPGRRECFLAAIERLYREAGFPVAVVTTSAGRQEYEGVVARERSVEWIVGPAGGDTAWTVQMAWRTLAGRAGALWLHPVDLPLVQPPTITALIEESTRRPESALRPVHRGIPGHPVILPAVTLTRLAGWWPARSVATMHETLEQAVKTGLMPSLLSVEVPDAGASLYTASVWINLREFF